MPRVWRLLSAPTPLAGVRRERKQISDVVANLAISKRCDAKNSLSKTRAKFAIEKVAVDVCESVDSVEADGASRLVLDDERRLGTERNVVKSVEYAFVGSDGEASFAAVRPMKNSITVKDYDESSVTIVGTKRSTCSVDRPLVECDAVAKSWVDLIRNESCIEFF